MYCDANKTTLIGQFWRLYDMYRNGKDDSLFIKQVNISNQEIIDLWNVQLPVLKIENTSIYNY